MKNFPLVFRHGLGFIACLLAASPLVQAGDIVGQVVDANTKAYLASVNITIEPTGTTVIADHEGHFRIFNLSPGTYQVHANYLGYATATAVAIVGETGEANVAVELGSDITNLNSMVVEGYREGRAKALQQKRTAENIIDIVSADSAGNLPDRNVAEAASRLPGVNLMLSQGEGTYVSIRGIDPNLNGVTLDGVTMSAPGGYRLGRAVPLDVLSSSQISQIEVIKTVTPDMDANSLGGTLNIKTASAFDFEGRTTNGAFSMNMNDNANKAGYGLQTSFSDMFGDKKQYGLMLSTSYDTRYFRDDFLQTAWNLESFNGAPVYVPNSFELHPETGSSQRYGVTLNLDFRPNENTQVFIRPNFNSTKIWTQREEIIYSVNPAPGHVTLDSPTSGVFAQDGTRLERRSLVERDDQNLFNLSGGIKQTFGQFTLEPTVSYSMARFTLPIQEFVQFRDATGDPGTIRFNDSDFSVWTWQPSSSKINDPSTFPLRRTREENNRSIKENTYTAKVDLRRDFDDFLGHSGYVKIGFKYSARDRDSNQPSYRLVPVGNWTLGNIGVLPGRNDVYNGHYSTGFTIDWDKTWAYIVNNPSLTKNDPVDSLQNSVSDSYKINEDIFSGYTMGSLQLSKNLTLLGGLRWEHTQSAVRASEYLTASNTITPQYGATTYDNVMPNVQLVYKLTDRLSLRAAVSNTIGRPAYEDARPYTVFTYSALPPDSIGTPGFDNTGSLTIGNPGLRPFNSLNYDLSLEYYTKDAGIFSVAGFYKDIDKPIYSFDETQRNVVYNGLGFDTLDITSTRNADSARLLGLELNVYQPFRFLPSPFDGFGVDANVTLTSSHVTIPERPNENLPFFRQPKKSANLTLFYEKYGFTVRVAYRYESDWLDTLGTDPLSDIFRKARGTIDTQVRYRFAKEFTLTASIRNLTDKTEDYMYGQLGLMRTSRDLGRDYNLGVDFDF